MLWFPRIGTSDTADREAVVAIVVVGRVDTTVEVEVVSVGAIRVRRRGPITPLVAGVVQVTIVEVPATYKREEQERNFEIIMSRGS